ncbi:MAG: ubiquinone biosynthesis protein [Opitutae bacterium]|nr:ubiquinone biosynthesis protein [Opitutae bacterium]
MTNPDPDAVRATFEGIAPRYDLANHLLSGGLDFLWRRRLIREAKASRPSEVLDLATGSGDVALALREALPAEVKVTGLDFCPPMLAEAERKRISVGCSRDSLRFVHGDCLSLDFPDSSFDLVTIAFGLRNLSNRVLGLSEMHRLLRPGGRLLILEFSQPFFILRPFYYLYLRGFLPLFARLVTGDRKAYEYLGSSISGFPDRFGLAEELRQANFGKVNFFSLTGAVVALHLGEKK